MHLVTFLRANRVLQVGAVGVGADPEDAVTAARSVLFHLGDLAGDEPEAAAGSSFNMVDALASAGLELAAITAILGVIVVGMIVRANGGDNEVVDNWQQPSQHLPPPAPPSSRPPPPLPPEALGR